MFINCCQQINWLIDWSIDLYSAHGRGGSEILLWECCCDCVCKLCTCICLSVCLCVCVHWPTSGATGPNYTACKSPTWRPPPPSSRQHLGNDDCLQVRSLNIIDANILHFFTPPPSRFWLLDVCFGLGSYTAAFTYSIARRTYAYGLLLFFLFEKSFSDFCLTN